MLTPGMINCFGLGDKRADADLSNDYDLLVLILHVVRLAMKRLLLGQNCRGVNRR
jgi:hypothetical protein